MNKEGKLMPNDLLSFIVNASLAIWTWALLWPLRAVIPPVVPFEGWETWMVLFIFLLIWQAVYLGVYFRWGLQAAGLMMGLIWVPLFFFGQFWNRGFEWAIRLAGQFPFLVLAAGMILAGVVWTVCWCWAVANYRGMLQGEPSP